MNIVAISGHLTHKPELKTTSDGVDVCTFAVAVKRPHAKDKTDFITCVAWNQKAVFVSKYFDKGQKIEIGGVLTSRSWSDSQGNRRTSLEVLCDDISFGAPKKESSENTELVEIEESDLELMHSDDFPF